MRPAPILTIPQPCAESWAAMRPAATGRHCAACAKTVVDFTLKTDAEILAYLAKAVGTRTCGRFAAGQLERPLQRAVPVAPTRWRAWLAAAVAVWSLREAVGSSAEAQASTKQCIVMGGLPMVAANTIPAQLNPIGEQHSAVPTQEMVLRGMVLDAVAYRGVPGATVLLAGTNIGVATSSDGSFEIRVPTALAASAITVSFSCVGYLREQRTVRAGAPDMVVAMASDTRALGELVIIPRVAPPTPWPARRIYDWGKYWFMRPFGRG